MAEYSLSEPALVCALGADRAEIERNLALGVAPGMKPLENLSGGDRTVFGFAPLGAAQAAASPTRVGALIDAAMAQLDLDALYREIPHDHVAAVVGTSNSTMEEFTDNPDRIDMAYPAERLKEKWGVGGPAWSVSTACSSSGKVFASARNLLESGFAEAVIVGGADAYTRTVVEGFHALEALSPTLTRPLSPFRDGINLGEGAAFFILRRAQSGAPGLRLLGVGESSDAYHLTAPDPSGRGAEAAMRAALAEARLKPEDISFVNLHGTGTVYNDAMESAAVERVFGKNLCRFSTKPLTGHCLGAAGAVEAALCALALRTRSGRCLSNSFAFGGSNVSVILAK